MWAVLSQLLSFTFHDDDDDDHDVHDNDHNHHEDNIYYNEGGRCCNPVVFPFKLGIMLTANMIMKLTLQL